MRLIGRGLVSLALAASLAVGGPIGTGFAGEAEDAVLSSFVGEFSGRGQLTGKTTESVACQLDVQKAAASRLRYSGRCVIAGERVPLRGTISYSDARKRYEATASGMGTVAGQKRGSGVAFTMGRQYRQRGQRGTFAVTIALSRGSVVLDFAIADEANGPMKARIPLARS